MSARANPVKIGAFVLGALVLLVAAILFFSSTALWQDKHRLVSYFPGTVRGLKVGARVEFEGVQVGQVTDIALEYHADDGSFSMPVRYEIWSDNITIIGGTGEGDVNAVYRMLIEERGLRAKLISLSFVTGQYMIGLTLQPDTPIRRLGPLDSDLIEIPTIEADRDRLASMLEQIDLDQLASSAIQALEAIRELAASQELRELIAGGGQTLAETRRLITGLDAKLTPLLQRLDTTLQDYARLANSADARINSLADSLERTSAEIQRVAAELGRRLSEVSGPAKGALVSADRAFKRADQALASIDSLVAEESKPRYDLELLLEEAANTARSLRILADYLQQHPDALIRGK